MLKVETVLKYISSQKYQLSPALLTFHNYLQHLVEPQEPWNPAILTHFFNDCLLYPHWQQNRTGLKKDIMESLLQVATLEQQDLGLATIQWPDEMQIVEIETAQNFSDLVNSYLTFQYQKTGSKFRLVPDGEKMIYAVVLHNDRSLSVRQFDRKFTLRQGSLVPLRTDLEVHFNSDLDLETEIPQKIEIAPFVTCRFIHQGESTDATLVRGYIFQKFHEFKAASIESYPRLFYTLKRIEQFFLRQDSNPFYLNLTQTLERTLNLLRLGDFVDPTQLTELQVRAQNALEYVFDDDKLLSLLLRDFDYQMVNSVKQKRPNVGQLSHLDFIEDKAPEARPWQPLKKTRESDLTN